MKNKNLGRTRDGLREETQAITWTAGDWWGWWRGGFDTSA